MLGTYMHHAYIPVKSLVANSVWESHKRTRRPRSGRSWIAITLLRLIHARYMTCDASTARRCELAQSRVLMVTAALMLSLDPGAFAQVSTHALETADGVTLIN